MLHKTAMLVRGRPAALAGVALVVPLAQVLVMFAVDPAPAQLAETGVAAVWLSALFGAMWMIDELLQAETEAQAWTWYLVAARSERFFWEWWGICTLAGAWIAALAWGAAAVIFDVPVVEAAGVVLVTVLEFGVGLAALSVLLARMRWSSGLGAFFGPLLLFPLVAPLMLAMVQASRVLLVDTPIEPQRWLLLGALFGILYTIIGSLVVPLLLKE